VTVKKYLEQAYHLDKLINAKCEQVTALKVLAQKVSIALTADKISSGSLKNKTEDYICKWIDLEHEINNDIDRLVELRRGIQGMIDNVPNPTLKLLLTLRYLNYKKLADIAAEMHYSIRRVQQLHCEALEGIKKYWEVDICLP
jgi:DNA-directed RNA polymerase specialized sigma subunit